MSGRSWLFKKLYRLVEQSSALDQNDQDLSYTSHPAQWNQRTYKFLKRCLDIAGAIILVVIAFPAFVVIGILIRRDSFGPVLFIQERVGKGGQLFRLYKFRTMVVAATEVLEQSPELREQYQDTFKIKNDPRITPIGGFLRKSSLDELPQLINVVRGEMSLVGPRPLLGPELSAYGVYQHDLLSVKPGLTGLWQVLGRSDTGWPEHVRMDLSYVARRSLSLDLCILCATLPAVLSGRGAY